MELSVVMPCLNERETVEICVKKALKSIELLGINGEVVVADNGSTDGSVEIAAAAGARVVPVSAKGYGNALIGGINAARGQFIIIGDADDSYDFTNLTPFLEKLRAGYELVMGNRFLGGIKPGAMPFLHRYLGNPVLSGIGRLFFRIPVGDFHCGLRGFTKAAYDQLDLQTTGMEFASEMVVKASLPRIAYRRGAHNTFSRRTQSAAAFAVVARWLAALAIHAVVQSTLVVFVPWVYADSIGHLGHAMVMARAATGIWGGLQYPYIPLCGHGYPGRLPGCLIRSFFEGLCYQRRTPARGRKIDQTVSLCHFGSGVDFWCSHYGYRPWWINIRLVGLGKSVIRSFATDRNISDCYPCRPHDCVGLPSNSV